MILASRSVPPLVRSWVVSGALGRWRQNVLLFLVALEAVLRREGWKAFAGAGVDAAMEFYAAADGEGSVEALEAARSPAVRSAVTP
jgi:hypothetical protein